MHTLTQEYLREYFDYREDGNLVRRKTAGPSTKEGAVVGLINKMGRSRFKVLGKLQSLHRMIFLWHTGELPKMLDHIDRDVLNNRIENLRICTTSQNNRNATKAKGCTSKYKGVTARGNRWRAVIYHEGKNRSLGYYDIEEDAALAYDIALLSIDPEFGLFNFNKENYHRQA